MSVWIFVDWDVRWWLWAHIGYPKSLYQICSGYPNQEPISEEHWQKKTLTEPYLIVSSVIMASRPGYTVTRVATLKMKLLRSCVQLQTSTSHGLLLINPWAMECLKDLIKHSLICSELLRMTKSQTGRHTCLLYLVTINYLWHLTHNPRQRAAESIQKLPRLEDSSRGYKKAPEGERDKETFRAPLDDQNNLGPTSFDPLLFSKHSRSVFQYRTLDALRQLRQTFPGDSPWLSASSW